MLGIETLVKLPCAACMGCNVFRRPAVGGDKVDVSPIHCRDHEQVKDQKDAGGNPYVLGTHLTLKVGTGNNKCNRFCSHSWILHFKPTLATMKFLPRRQR